MRWLLIALVLAVGSAPADAQVFKPKAKKTEKAQPAAKKSKAKTTKAAAKKAPAKKRVKKKSSAADRSRPGDLTPEPESKDADRDYVRIWEDEEIE